ncbi:MAG: hypothetical protein JWM68_1719 [Verrucomicrobiales bacterium]|nr:hypothetical protein [Verrucomicrobiales bacterium]
MMERWFPTGFPRTELRNCWFFVQSLHKAGWETGAPTLHSSTSNLPYYLARAEHQIPREKSGGKESGALFGRKSCREVGSGSVFLGDRRWGWIAASAGGKKRLKFVWRRPKSRRNYTLPRFRHPILARITPRKRFPYPILAGIVPRKRFPYPIPAGIGSRKSSGHQFQPESGAGNVSRYVFQPESPPGNVSHTLFRLESPPGNAAATIFGVIFGAETRQRRREAFRWRELHKIEQRGARKSERGNGGKRRGEF